MKDLMQGIGRTGTDASTWNMIPNKYSWCLRHGQGHGIWLHKNVCLAAMSNPERRCPKTCSNREPRGKNESN